MRVQFKKPLTWPREMRYAARLGAGVTSLGGNQARITKQYSGQPWRLARLGSGSNSIRQSVPTHMGHVLLIVACHIWHMGAHDRQSLALKCGQCGREGIVYISENPRSRLRVVIDVPEGFTVLEHGRSFRCVACKGQGQVRVK
jgi:hypothetical protein